MFSKCRAMLLLGLVELPLWLAFPLILIFTVVVYTWHKRRFFRRHGIRTKPSTFLLGDLPLISKLGFGYITPETVKIYGKVFGTFTGNIPSLVVSDAGMIKQILVKQHHNFQDRMNYAVKIRYLDDVVTFAGGDKWACLRNTLSPSFSTSKLKSVCPHIQRCLASLHDVIEETLVENGESIDLLPIIKNYCVDLICSTGFGLNTGVQKKPDRDFIRHSREVVKLGFFKNPFMILNVLFPDLPFLKYTSASLFPEDCVAYFQKVTLAAFEDRKASNMAYRDILGTMINAHREDDDTGEQQTDENLNTHAVKPSSRGLSDREILANSLAFMTAGQDTLTAGLAWTIFELVLNPHCLEKLIAEVDAKVAQSPPTYDNVSHLPYMEMVINESLRLHPPTGRTSRICREETTICGVTIPKNTSISIYATALHFMEEYWHEPYEFRPERFAPENKESLNEHAFLGWGVGPRFCLGKRLALLELKMTFVGLLQKYTFRKSDKLKVPMDVNTGGVSSPASPLFVRVYRRKKET